MKQYKISGLDELKKGLQKLERNVKDLEGTHQVPFDELFTSSFMSKHTPVNSFDDFLSSGGFKATTQEEFEAIPNEEFDKYVSENSDFSSWEDMLGEASSEYMLKKLGF